METIDTIMQRRSIRKYKKAAIPEDELKKILECGRQAPSAGNRQPWHFIVVRDNDMKQKVAKACSGQMWMADADVILAGVGIPEKSRGSTGRMWYPVDVAIAMQNMILAATDLGYGTCWIGAFDEDSVKEILNIPDENEVVALTPIGVSDQEPAAKPRKSAEEIFTWW